MTGYSALFTVPAILTASLVASYLVLTKMLRSIRAGERLSYFKEERDGLENSCLNVLRSRGNCKKYRKLRKKLRSLRRFD